MNVKSIIIGGVGGQGIILASEIVSQALFDSGWDVKKNEIHGMSQRGGSVVSFIRYGEKVHSPIVAEGEGDILLAFEKLEGLRNLPYIRKEGLAIVADTQMDPVPVMLGAMTYPDNIEQSIREYTSNFRLIDPMPSAKEIGNVKIVNVILLGALSRLLKDIDESVWLDTIKTMVKPSYLELNLKAFEAGRTLAG